jgi:hypothetical protein
MSSNPRTTLLEKLKSKILGEIPDRLALLVATKQFLDGKDVDLFVILENAPTNDPYNVQAYIKLVKALKTTEEEIKKESGINVVDFSTYRIEHYHCRLMQQDKKGTQIRLHMLVYPTIAHFLIWENHSIISSICCNCTLLYGRQATLDEIRASTRTVCFEKRIQPLVSLLFETYRNAVCHTFVPKETKEILVSEGLTKLEYAVRFILWELLRENLRKIPSPEADEVLRLAKRTNVGVNLVELLEKIKGVEQKETGLSYLKLLYEASMSTVNTLVFDMKGNKKNVHP